MRRARAAVLAVAAAAAGALRIGVAQTLDSEAEAAVLAGADALRAGQGLPVLAVDPALSAAARDFARFMAREARYGHEADGRKPAARAEAAGYAFCRLAENIAWLGGAGRTGARGGARLIDGWSRSPGHRANLLEPAHTQTGAGVARGDGRVYAVQLFGRPASARVRFEVRNGAGAPVRYRLDDTDWTLPPRATRRHERCDAGRIGTGDDAQPVADGARYVVERDARGAAAVRRDER